MSDHQFFPECSGGGARGKSPQRRPRRRAGRSRRSWGRSRRLRLQRDLYRSNRDLLRRHPDGWHLSDSADENAILIDTDETVTLTNATVTKSGDSDGGDSYITSFTGDASQIISNGYTLYANGVALEGTK